MNRKAFIVVLIVLVLFSLNFCVAQEISNSTIEDSSSTTDNDVLTVSDTNQTVQKAASKMDTKIDVNGNTTFDVIDSYFQIKLSDVNGRALKNTPVTFTIAGNTFSRTTNNYGIASLQLKLNDGSYKVTAKFLGNSNYKASSLTTTIKMTNTRVVAAGLSNAEIQNIIDNAKDRNVILFKGSSYSNINLVINKRLALVSYSNTVLKSSTSNPVITIKGKGASLTSIRGFNIQGGGDGILVSNSDYVIINNNDITAKGNGIVATGTKYLNISKNNIVKNSKAGIVLADTSSTYIFNNKINNNGGNGIEAAKSSYVYIHDNILMSNSGNGIQLSNIADGKNYGDGPDKVYINNNKIYGNLKSGIIINEAGDNVNINSNTVTRNYGDGITVGHVGSNRIQSNVIVENYNTGINFIYGYEKPSFQDISYNAIFSNSGREVEAHDAAFDSLEIGDNWYSDLNTLCPKIKSNNIQFRITQTGENQFQATFLDSRGNVASLLPDRQLSVQTEGGNSISLTVSAGVATFNYNANNGDHVKATVDDSIRDTVYNSAIPNSNPVNGQTPSYDYPDIPYDSVDPGYYDEVLGGGNGNGDGTGEGNNGNANQGQGNSNQGSSDNTGNSSQSQRTDPGSNANNPVNDVSQSYQTDTTTSPESASESSAGDTSGSNSQSPSQSVAKQIVIEEDEFFRVTGMTFIVLLIILTIGYYYRDDIKEMNSKR